MPKTMSQRWRWRDVPVRTKLTASFAVLVGLVSAFIYLYFPAQFEQRSRQALIDESMTVAQMTAYSIGAALYFDDAPAGQELLSGLEATEDVAYVVVSDTNGRTFASYNRLGRAAAAGSERALDERTIYTVRVNVNFDGKWVGTLDLGHSLRHLQDEVRSAKRAVTYVSLVIFLFGMGAAAVFSRILTNPLRRISEVAVEIAQGNLDKRALSDAQDEVGILAASFNQMVDSLQDAQNQKQELNRSLENRVVERTRELRDEVSERRAAEDALRRSEKLLRSIYDTVGDVLFLIDVEPDGEFRFASVNQAFSSVTGIPADTVVRKLVRDVIPEPSLTLVLSQYRRAIQERTTVRWEETSVYPKGMLTGEVCVAPIFDTDGHCTHLVGAVHDVTARKQAEDALERQRLFLRHVIDTDPNFVFAKNREGKFTMVNQAVADAYGTTVEELVGKGDADFNANAEEVQRFREDDREVIDLQKEKHIPEEPITDSNGRLRWLQTIKRPLGKDPSGQELLLGVATDITLRKAAEEALRFSEEQLRQAVKMEAVGRLAGGVAHDFNNLLAVIIGQIEMTRGQMGPDHPMAVSMAAIDEAASRAADLTRQLLAFSRKQILEPKIIDLNQIVSGTEKMLRRVIGEDIELISSLSPELWTVMADPGQLQQVVMNLVINARDAMPKGGTLTIHTTNVEFPEEVSTASGLMASGAYVALTVQDTGIGMERGTLARIFEPFFTTKGAGKGTGLGLSTVIGIVEQSHGNIDVESTPGVGTTFRIYLPCADAALASPGTEPSSGDHQTQTTSSESILLVEDEPSVREMMNCMLQSAGYDVQLASNGQEAVSMLSTSNGTVDLMITDVIMPGMSGVELAIQALRISPRTRILYMSGYTYDVLAQGGALEEGTLLLQKPFRLDTLKQMVRKALDNAPSLPTPAIPV